MITPDYSIAERAAARLDLLLTTRGVRIVPLDNIDRNVLAEADTAINESVGWSQYKGVARSSTKVAVVADKIVGYICGSNYIGFIPVHKEWQDKQVGEALMVDAIKTVAERGGSSISLDYRANNPKTKHFYQKIASILGMEKPKTEFAGSYPPKEGQEAGDPREHLIYKI